MAHFYGTLKGNRGEATRMGTPGSGITVQAASWRGAVKVSLFVANDEDIAHVSLAPWHGAGTNKLLYEGPVGGREEKPLPASEAATTTHFKPEGLRFLGMAPVNFDAAVSALSMPERQELQNWLDNVAQRAALLSGYLDARGTTGCGDSGHAEAVKVANRRLVRVRKGMGYTDPKAGQVRF